MEVLILLSALEATVDKVPSVGVFEIIVTVFGILFTGISGFALTRIGRLIDVVIDLQKKVAVNENDDLNQKERMKSIESENKDIKKNQVEIMSQLSEVKSSVNIIANHLKITVQGS